MNPMKNTLISTLLIVLTGFFFAGPGKCGDQPVLISQGAIPDTLLLVGIFSPADTVPKGNTITIQVQDQKYRFRITEARNMIGTASGESIIDELFPPTLRLVGAKALIEPLLKPDILGNSYSLLGNFYLSGNFMYLSKVKKGRLFEDEPAQGK